MVIQQENKEIRMLNAKRLKKIEDEIINIKDCVHRKAVTKVNIMNGDLN